MSQRELGIFIASTAIVFESVMGMLFITVGIVSIGSIWSSLFIGIGFAVLLLTTRMIFSLRKAIRETAPKEVEKQ